MSTPAHPSRRSLPEPLLARGRARLESARLLAAGELAGEGADAPEIVFLLPAADDTPARRWPWEHWAELVRALRRARPTLRLAVLTSAAELWPAVRIHEETGRILPVLGPELDAALALAVLAHGALAVGVDNRHLRQAAALGVPSVGIYGPSDPYANPPAGNRHTAVFQQLWCTPCQLRRCPLLHQRCLRRLPADSVASACLARLAAGEEP